MMMLLVGTFSHCRLKVVVTKLICVCMALTLICLCQFPGYYWLPLSVSLVTVRVCVLARVHPG